MIVTVHRPPRYAVPLQRLKRSLCKQCARWRVYKLCTTRIRVGAFAHPATITERRSHNIQYDVLYGNINVPIYIYIIYI